MTSSLRVVCPLPSGLLPEPPIRFEGVSADLRSAFQPGASCDRLFQPNAVAVTTGQQPGLFGGPLYTVHKAIAARALAAELERRWLRPVVPVFWVAGDDHDWTEASTAAWWTPHDDVRHWHLNARAENDPQSPMSGVPVPMAELVAARDALAADLVAGPERDRALDWIDRHWQGTATMASAFVGAMHYLLEPLGVAVLDPTHHAFKQAQRPWIRAALEQSTEIDRTLSSIPDGGTGISAGDGVTLVFLEATSGRDRLVRVAPERFTTRRSGESFTTADLRTMLDAAPERFSANVLLRPVVEAALLPTVAYVAGPGEARYLREQARAIYPLLGVTPQAVVPRWTGTLVDATSDRLLRRVALEAETVIRGGDATEREILMRDMPPEATEALVILERTIDQTATALGVAGAAIDAVLDRAIQGRTGKMHGIARDLEHLLRRHLKRRDDVAWSQYRRLRQRLMPDDAPQERIVSVVAALGRWGSDWLTVVVESTDTWARTLLEPSSPGT